MTNFYGIGSYGVNTLFSSYNTSNTANASTTSFLSDYYSIRSGSYKKLLTAYYAKNGEDAKISTSTSADSSKDLVNIREATDELKESADALIKQGKKSVFAKDEDGNYDMDKVTKAVKQFVDDYNSTIEATEDSNTSSIASNSASLIRITQANENLLKKAGITIDADFKLKFDEAEFKKANMTDVRTLFNGTGSYAYNVSARASMINFNAETEINRANTYGQTGSYNYNYSMGDIYNAYL